MQKNRLSLLCFALSLLGILPVEAQNFTNGGFEITTITIPVDGYTALQLNSTWLVGWTVGGPGGGDLAVMEGTTELPPYQGSNWVVFGQGNTAAGASISQTFSTTPGTLYNVGFAIGQAGSATGPSVSEIVTASGGAVISSNRCVPSYGVWTPFSFSFTATTATTTFTFLDTSLTSDGVDVAVDGVTVTPQSENPVVTSSPVSVTAYAGNPVTFNSTASPANAFVQWYFGTTPISGATNTSLTMIASLASAGDYSAVFSNSFGTATSGVAVLTVIDNLLTNGSFEIVNGTPITPGGGMVLDLGATWLVGWTVGGPGGNMEVYNGDNDSLVPYDGQQFVVFNQGNTPVGGILSQTVATTPGQLYLLTFVEAETDTGDGAMSVSASAIDGAAVTLASNQFVAPSTSWTPCQLNFTADSTNTTIVFTDTSSGTEEVDVAMDDAVLTADMKPVVLTSPTNLTVAEGSTAVFSATASNATFVQWYEGTNVIPGANVGTLSFTAGYSSAGNYSAVFSNAFGTVTTAVATLTVTAGPFTNGGFEITTITIPVDGYTTLQLNSTWLVGWTVGGPGGGDLAVVDGTTELPPYQGSNWVVFGQGNTAAGASISQTFATIPGSIYDVGFAIGQAGSAAGPSVSEILTAPNGAIISSNRCVPSYGVWTPFSFNFTATSSNTTITFLDTSATSDEVDVAVDGVTVTDVSGPPQLTASPASVTTNAWELVTFTAAAAPTNSAVQWYYGSTPISGATSTNLSVIATAMSAGDYTAVFSNSFGTVTSAVAVLTVIPTLLTNGSFEAVTGTPLPAGGGMVLESGAAWLTGWTVGGPGGGNMEVYNGPNDNLTPYDGHQFVVFNEGNTPVGGTLSQTVATTPGQTYRLTFVEAETETGEGAMSISASIIGAGGATVASNQFIAPSTAWSSCQLNFTADSTNTTIIFTDTSAGTEEVDVALDGALLVETIPPTVLASPTNLTVTANSTAVFTASATNATSVQWYEGTNAIIGATGGTLSFIANFSSAGNYSAVFSNSYGSVTTAVATLTVVAGSFTNGSFEVLNGATISPGAAQTLAAGATWLLGWSVGGPGGNIEVANGSIEGLSPDQGQQFVIYNAGQTPTGGSLVQTFATAPGQIFQVSLDVAETGNGPGIMSISPVATTLGGSVLVSNLFVASSSTWTPYQFLFTATTSNTTLAFIDTSTSTASEDVALDNIAVTGYPYTGAPVILVSPTNQTVAVNSQVVFTAIASGGPSTVQWYQGTNAVPGATNGTLVLIASNSNAGSYFATFSNLVGTVNTTNAVLTVIDPPVIVSSPAGETVNVGAQVSFSASASGSPAAVQWSENGEAIPGATSPTLAFAASASSAGVYTATYSNIAGTATSVPAVLTVLGIPFTNGGFEVVTSGAIPVGASRTLSLGATWLVGWTPGGLGANMEVFNGSGDGFSPFEGQQFVIFDPTNAPTGGILSQTFNTVPGQICDILFVIAKSAPSSNIASLTAVATANNGTLLASNTCIATSSAWSEFELIFTTPTLDTTLSFMDTSDDTTGADLALDDVIVTDLPTNGAPVIVLSPPGLTVNAGQQATLSALASGAPSAVQWYQDGSPVGTGTNSTLTFIATDLTAGNYWAIFTNSFGSATTEAATVNVIDPPVISTSPVSQTVPAGTAVLFSASASGSSSTVQWYNGTNAVPGATSDFLDVVAGSGTAGYYTAVFSNSAGTATTSPAILTVLNLPFTNGSFELIDRSAIPSGSGVVLAASDTWLTGWTVGGPGGNLEVFNGSVDGLVPLDGQQFVAFNQGDTPVGGSLAQTFSTIVGQTYAVSWAVAKAGAGTGIMSLTAAALAADGTLLASNQSIALSAAWTPEQFGFTALSSNTTLIFKDTSTSTISADVALDDVILSPQPVLNLAVSAGNVALAWPSSATNFVLETSSSVTGPWSDVTGGHQTINGNLTTWAAPLTTNDVFYRLRFQ